MGDLCILHGASYRDMGQGDTLGRKGWRDKGRKHKRELRPDTDIDEERAWGGVEERKRDGGQGGEERGRDRERLTNEYYFIKRGSCLKPLGLL